METSLYRNVSTFLDFAYFWKVWKRLCIEAFPHFLNLSSFQYFIIVSVQHSGTVWNTNDDRYSDFSLFLKMWKRFFVSTFLNFAHVLKMWKRLYISWHNQFSTTYLDVLFTQKSNSFDYCIISSLSQSATNTGQ